VPLLGKVIENGRLISPLPSLTDSRAYHQERKTEFWPEYMRTMNPEVYHVHLSEQLWTLKRTLIERYSIRR
jgi:nicotinate phosphoribosyltransferase